METMSFSNAAVPPRVAVLTVVVMLATVLPSTASCYQVRALHTLRNMGRLELATAIGPESLAFDGHGGGPYTGVSDGSILVWRGEGRGWARYAVDSTNRRKECDGVGGGLFPPLESVCGRPLGLQFHKASGILYVADAYLGLLAVDPGGGEARQLTAGADDGAFGFTNGLDVDQRTGMVYFTDSSTRFKRWEYVMVLMASDSTGRLMKYDPRTDKVTVMKHGLRFPNGVALSDDGSFLLYAETGKCRIMRHWLRGPEVGSTEVFADVPGYPDNIRRAPDGDYWVGLNRESLGVWMSDPRANLVAVRVSRTGEVVEALDGRMLASVSEVAERDGVLWIGSVDMSYVEAFEL